jgi:recombinational DNA repair ATPase RecF
MRLAKVTIENFRHIKHLDIDLMDSIGRAREVSLLVGPNSSGKTTILDAIAAALGPLTQLPTLRQSLQLNPGQIVRRGELHAKVSGTIVFSEEEIVAAKEIWHLAQQPGEVPDAQQVKFQWQYPHPDHKRGMYTTRPATAWRIFQARYWAAKMLSTRRSGWDKFRKVGGVFTFDQQRTGMGKTIPPRNWEIISGGESASEEAAPDRYTSDPEKILLSLAITSRMRMSDDEKMDDFRLVQNKYADICTPHTLVGATPDAFGDLRVLFNDGRFDYGYEGLSSGEQMILLFLIRMATDHIHRSIVLVDEVELHLHPVWQRRLLDLIPKMGESNQLIGTTHSPYLRDVLPNQAIIELGDLEEQPAARNP